MLKPKTRRKTDQCLNCNTALGPEINYCPECGQENHERKAKVGTLLGDYAREFLTLDAKLPTTIWMLLSRPGQLTKEYLEGRRVRYLLPIRLYLICSIAFFFVLSLVPGTFVEFNPEPGQSNSGFSFTTSGAVEPIDTLAGSNTAIPELTESDSASFVATRVSEMANTPEETIRTRFLEYASLLMFFLLPMFALLVKMFYRRRYYVEALIFSLHVFSFFFLTACFMQGVGWLFDWSYAGRMPVWFVQIYLFIALIKVFEGHWALHLLKQIGLMLIFMFLFAIFIVAVGLLLIFMG